AQQTANVGAGRCRADVEALAYRIVRFAHPDPGEDIAFALSQILKQPWASATFGASRQGAHDFSGDCRCKQSITGADESNSFPKIVGSDVFEKIPGGSCLDRREHVFVFVKSCQYDHSNTRQQWVGCNGLGRGDTIHLRHANIHQDYIWLVLTYRINAGLAVVGFSNDFDIAVVFSESA